MATDLERAGLVNIGDVNHVLLQITEYVKKGKPNLIEMYTKGLRVNLMSNGLHFIDREQIGKLKKSQGVYSIIEVLTVEELYLFMEEHYDYIKQGQGSAVMTIMEYKLKEKMEDIYEDNYDLIFKGLED